MIEVQNIKVSYGKNLVLNDVNLALASHQVHGLIGVNGSGKTTLLHTLYKYIIPQSGQVLYEKETLTRKHIAFLPTQNFFYSRMTGQEYLSLFRANNQDFNIKKWNEVFRLPLSHLVENYSTGMKKKLALIGVLSLDRPILVLDEPSNGLDLESNQTLKKILLQLKEKGKTIIITSHILEMLWTTCDVIHHLENKKISGSYLSSEFKILEEKMTRQSQDDQLKDLIY